MLVRHGYGVLLFDRRGEGDSEGDPNAVGWNGDRDIKAAIAFLRERPDVDPDRIGGIGLSVGGELMLETAAETDALKAVVSEVPGFDPCARRRRRPGSKSGWRFRSGVGSRPRPRCSRRRAPAEPERRGRAHRTPPGLLHLRSQRAGGEDLSQDFYESAGEPKDVWEIPEGGHVGGAEARPREYERRSSLSSTTLS